MPAMGSSIRLSCSCSPVHCSHIFCMADCEDNEDIRAELAEALIERSASEMVSTGLMCLSQSRRLSSIRRNSLAIVELIPNRLSRYPGLALTRHLQYQSCQFVER